MKKTILLSALALPAALSAQDAIITAWKLNTSNTMASYYQYVGNPPNQTVQLVTMTELADVQAVCYDADSVWIQSDGLTTKFGPWLNPGTISAQNYTYRFPRNPQPATNHVDLPVIAAVGVLVNGIPIYGNGDSQSYDPGSGTNSMMGQGIWNREAYYNEGVSLDSTYTGHIQQDGAYHTHATPANLYDYLPSTEHSPIIGFAFDGYPIYGPYGYSDAMDNSSAVSRMQSSYALRSITQRTTLPDGTALTPQQYGPNVSATFPLGMYVEDYGYTAGLGDLDEYNGRTCVTPEYPNGTYAYFVTMAANGDPEYPYFIGNQYYGVPAEDNLNDLVPNITMPSSGLTCGQAVGVSLLERSKELRLYPNPTQQLLYIEFAEQPLFVSVGDALGRTIDITTTMNNGGLLQIATNDWAMGIYTVSLHYAEGVVTKMVVKE